MNNAYYLTGLLLWVGMVSAEEFPTPPDLPPTALARQILNQDPHVLTARAEYAMTTTEAQHLKASNYEWSTRLSGQQRRYQVGDNSTEWNVELQRPIRLPNKAAIDQQIGVASLAMAEAGIGEATHEAARSLVSLWLDWLGATARLQVLQAQEKLSGDNFVVVEKRVRAGDTAKMDMILARADRASAKRAVAEALTDVAEAKAMLAKHFPNINPAIAPTLADPALPMGDLLHWRERIQKHSDPLRIAHASLEKAKQLAGRATADKTPDPTVGIYTASEARGDERVIGVSLTLPLSGSHRALQATKAQQAVAIAEQVLETERRELLATVEASYTAATGRYAAWVAAEEAAQDIQMGTDLTIKAYGLGEAELQTVLQARQQRLEAEEAALHTRLAALKAYYLLLVDGHYLWDLAHDD